MSSIWPQNRCRSAFGSLFVCRRSVESKSIFMPHFAVKVETHSYTGRNYRVFNNRNKMEVDPQFFKNG